ncbi:hypothetical protein [uncultured Eubacterium sp.]|uniref:hypothetical protein n=1 Tax=uncultured Eubacterium sp. TaxID=165185 RepID=UPI002673EBB3|nr:hypothetical protein [uncultured Eubacterium sp.]
MNTKIKKVTYIILVVILFCGCSKKQDNVNSKLDERFILPQYKQVLLTDLENCDIEFMKNMPFYDFEFRIISTKKLNADKIGIQFDTTIKYDCDVVGEEKIDKEKFGYALLCAYNGYEVKEQSKEIEQISEEDYRNVIINNNEFKELYVYTCSVTLDTEHIGNSADNEINQMTVTYNNDKYDFDIGRIYVDNSRKLKETFARDLDGEDSACQTINGLDYISLDNEKDGKFELRLDEVIETFDEKMEIQSFNLKNTRERISIEEAKIVISNESGVVQFEYNKDKKTVIPPDSSVSIILQCKSDNLKNNIGYYISPIVCIDYKINKKSGILNVPIMARACLRTAYEIYAYKADSIDIFNLYLNNLNN